jgi:hypothetical protein
MATSDYEEHVRGKVSKRLDDAYFVTFTCMLSGISKIQELDRRAHAPVDIVLDYHEQFGHKALETLGELRRILGPEEDSLLGEIRMRGKQERRIPLEAADMLAWCQYRKLTRPDGAHLPIYRSLIGRIPRNHFQAGPRFLQGYARSGWRDSRSESP